MTHIVRIANLTDAKALSHIAASTFALACSAGTPRDDIDAYIDSELTQCRFEDHVASSSKSILVAEINSRIVGYLMLCYEEAPADLIAQRPLELRQIYVLPEYHGSGVAADLIACAVHEAIIGGYDSLWLGVSGSNQGLTFYRKHGFSVAGKYHFPLGNIVYEGVLMSRRMSSDNSLRPKPLHGSA
ncbi:MAG: GNAT family N-acetyltransferase [Candidatus Acidiferrales bacterium]